MSSSRIMTTALLALLLGVAPLHAEPPPAEPIHIESDSLDIDDGRGISTYRGNVLFRRGDSRLRADEIVIRIDDQQRLDTIEARGAPARFLMEPQGEEEAPAEGEARRILYRERDGIMRLEGGARLSQGGNLFSGEVIEFDTVRRIVRAGAAVEGSRGGRVKVVIQPRPREE